MGGSQLKDDSSSSTETIKCTVCGEPSGKWHYGTYCCHGCKTFFRRTVLKGVTPICQYNNNCIITEIERNNCRSCRLRKCLSAGMKIEVVCLNEKQLRSKTKSNKLVKKPARFGTSVSTINDPPKNLSFTQTPIQIEYDIPTNDNVTSETTSDIPFNPNKDPNHNICFYNQSQTKDSFQYKNNLASTKPVSIETSYYAELAVPNKPMQFVVIQNGMAFIRLLENDILNIVKWLEKIPFLAQLSDNDKNILLQNRMAECLLLGLAYRTYVHGSRKLCSPQGPSINIGEYLLFPNQMVLTVKTSLAILEPFVTLVNKNLVQKMSQLQFDSLDLMFLRLIMLLTPTEDTILQNPVLVSRIRDEFVECYEKLISYNLDTNTTIDYTLVALQPSPLFCNQTEINLSIRKKFTKAISLLLNLSIISEKIIDVIVAFDEITLLCTMPFISTYIFKDYRYKVAKYTSMVMGDNLTFQRSSSTRQPNQSSTNPQQALNLTTPEACQNIISAFKNVGINQVGEYEGTIYQALNTHNSNLPSTSNQKEANIQVQDINQQLSLRTNFQTNNSWGL